MGQEVLTFDNLSCQVPIVIGHDRQPVTGHSEQGDSQAPHVHSGAVVALTQENLWDDLARAATARGQLPANILVAEPKFRQFDVAIGVRKDTPRLQVPVHDAPLVAVVDRGHQLPEDAADLQIAKVPPPTSSMTRKSVSSVSVTSNRWTTCGWSIAWTSREGRQAPS